MGMYFRAVAGLVAGLCAGVVAGIMYMLMTIPDAEGVTIPLLTVISRAVSNNDPATGWSFHLFNCAVLGVIFGLAFGYFATSMFRSALLGLAVGFVFWIFSGLIVLPTLIHQPALSSLSTPELQPATVGTLIGSIVYGILLGSIYFVLYSPILEDERRERARRAAEQGEPDRSQAPV
jgi:hypothetical protein